MPKIKNKQILKNLAEALNEQLGKAGKWQFSKKYIFSAKSPWMIKLHLGRLEYVENIGEKMENIELKKIINICDKWMNQNVWRKKKRTTQAPKHGAGE